MLKDPTVARAWSLGKPWICVWRHLIGPKAFQFAAKQAEEAYGRRDFKSSGGQKRLM